MLKSSGFRVAFILALLFGAAGAASARTWTVQPGQSIAAAIGKAHPGDRIEVMPGLYHEGSPNNFNAVTITTDAIDLVGLSQGNQSVVLENAGSQSYGIWVSPADSTGQTAEGADEKPPCAASGAIVHGFAIRGFTLRGFAQDGIHLACVDGFLIEGNVAEKNSVYGIFPVLSSYGALVDNTVLGTVRDAGVYVGQSDDVLVSGNVSSNNLIGIEVENSRHVTVIDNQSAKNTIGILVDVLFDKVKLVQQTTLVADNDVQDNNRPNSADPDDITALFPPGLGILLVGADTTTVIGNTVGKNGFAGIAVTSLCIAFTLEGKPCPTLDVDPNPDHNRILYNHVLGNGKISTGNPILDALRADLLWDGSGVDNCWLANKFATSFPAKLPACPAVVTSRY